MGPRRRAPRSRSSRDPAADAFDAIPALVATLEGPELRMVALNHAAREIVGDHVMGQPMAEALPAVMHQQMGPLIADCYRTGQTYREPALQVWVGSDEGLREVVIDWTVAPWGAADGTRRGVFTYGADITAEVRAHRRADEQMAETARRHPRAVEVVTELQRAAGPVVARPAPPRPRCPLPHHGERTGGRGRLVRRSAAGGRAGRPDGRRRRRARAAGLHGDGPAAGGAGRAAPAGRGPGGRTRRAGPLRRRAAGCRIDHGGGRLLDPVAGEMVYSTCGYPPPLVVPAASEPRFLPATGAGPLAAASPPTRTRPLGPGRRGAAVQRRPRGAGRPALRAARGAGPASG